MEESSSKRRRFRTAQTDEEKQLREKLLKQKEKDEILVEYLSLRGVGVLLEKNQLEVEGSVSYTHDTARGGTNFTTGEETNFDSGQFDGSLRYGLTNDTQLSLSLPVVFSQIEEVVPPPDDHIRYLARRNVRLQPLPARSIHRLARVLVAIPFHGPALSFRPAFQVRGLALSVLPFR